jgi:hypothetical protein
MAQAQSTVPMASQSSGGLDECGNCGRTGTLDLVGGTDPEETEAMGGFEETYRCSRCDNTGRYTFRYADGKEAYSGVCAEYNHV